MVTATLEQLEQTYHQQWDMATILPERQPDAKAVAARIFANKPKYKSIEAQTGVPYWWLGAVHNRESDLSFKTHLHNGDSLTARTYHVPSGRPASGAPPFTFEESAIDAVKSTPHNLHLVKRWSVERGCYEWERYNGFGYLKHGPSPYVYAGMSTYKDGKFVADGKYVAGVVDKQLGCVIVARELALLDPEVALALQDRESMPPDDVRNRETKDLRNVTKVGGGIAGGGVVTQGTQTATTQADTPQVISPLLTFSVIAFGIAIMIVATVLISRKLALVQSKWS